MEFEWDDAKAKANLRKHGISFGDATSAFYDALSVTIADPDHSAGEHRFLLIGVTLAGRLVVVSHTTAAAEFGSLMHGGRPAANE